MSEYNRGTARPALQRERRVTGILTAGTRSAASRDRAAVFASQPFPDLSRILRGHMADSPVSLAWGSARDPPWITQAKSRRFPAGARNIVASVTSSP